MSERDKALAAISAHIEPFEKKLSRLEKLKHWISVIRTNYEKHFGDRATMRFSKVLNHVSTLNEIREEFRLVEMICELSLQAVETVRNMVHLLLSLHHDAIDPIIETCRLEADAISKIVSSMKFGKSLAVKIPPEDLARTCDVISWGLDDVKPISDIVPHAQTELDNLKAQHDQLKEDIQKIRELVSELDAMDQDDLLDWFEEEDLERDPKALLNKQQQHDMLSGTPPAEDDHLGLRPE